MSRLRMYTPAIDQLAAQSPAAAECFHCGLTVPRGAAYFAHIAGIEQPMCCPGCQAVAEAIAGAGLADYYRHRVAVAANPEARPDASQLYLFDLPEVQKTFVQSLGGEMREAALILEDVSCAACVWLIERRVGALPGVRSVDINFATRRARIGWDESRIRLSQILAAIASIGHRAQPYDAARSDDMHRRERRVALWRLGVAAFGMMQVMMYASAVYFADGDMSADIESLMRWASLILTVPVVFYAAAPFFQAAARDLRSRRVGMDTPVALGIAIAFVASVWATLTGTGEVYYDSIAMFVFLLLGARFFESGARAKAARAAEHLARLVPATTERVPAFPGARATERVAVAQLSVGDTVLVRAGAPIPADGRLIEGSTRVDESLLTGESRLVARSVGDALIGGAINATSPVFMRVESVGPQTVLAAIVRLLDRASAEKPRIAQLADRVARRFLTVLLIFAAIVAATWTVIDPARALWITFSVLVVACPCALSLATPAALTAATGALAREGVLITRGHTLETLASASHFVFDKTGTLTRGSFELIGVTPFAQLSREHCLALAAVLEATSEHPIARALRDAAVVIDAAPKPMMVDHVVNLPGAGIEGDVDGWRLRVGTPSFVAELAGAAPADLLGGVTDDSTIVALGAAGTWLAVFALGDPLRKDAGAVVRALLERGIEVSVVSGDRTEAVHHVARQLGISRVVARAAPQDKLDYVRELQADGATVAMVGDGVNDAPVLAAATVSLAMSRSTDVARASADAVLLTDRLQGVVDALHVAERTRSVIRQNLGWAFAYNIVTLPIAALGWVSPWMAGVGMATSSLLVVANALRLARPDAVPASQER
ncbi:MAG: heavy metal translocating P-type ATPase [Burkholderiaceae bacterium]